MFLQRYTKDAKKHIFLANKPKNVVNVPFGVTNAQWRLSRTAQSHI
jgi:hypothetical protein